MTWFHISIIANVIAAILIAILALDRVHFRSICELRHNPIDQAIQEIKDSIKGIRENMKKDFQRIWEAIDRLK